MRRAPGDSTSGAADFSRGARAPRADERLDASTRRSASRISAAKRCALGRVRARLDELPVPRQADRGREEHLRDRLGAPDAPLQLVLLAEAEALGEERGLVEGRGRVAPLEAVGDDAVGLEERPQHAVRAERPECAHQRRGSRPRPRRARSSQSRVVQRELGAISARNSSFSAKKNSNLRRSRRRIASSQNSRRRSATPSSAARSSASSAIAPFTKKWMIVLR